MQVLILALVRFIASNNFLWLILGLAFIRVIFRVALAYITTTAQLSKPKKFIIDDKCRESIYVGLLKYCMVHQFSHEELTKFHNLLRGNNDTPSLSNLKNSEDEYRLDIIRGIISNDHVKVYNSVYLLMYTKTFMENKKIV